MDKYLCRKDVYDELEKAMRDRSHLTQKVMTDKNGHQRKVWVRGGEEPSQQKTKKTEEPADNKNAKFQNGIKSVEEIINRYPEQFNAEKTKESIKKVESNIEQMKKDGTSDNIIQLNQGRLKALKDHLGKLNGTNETAKHSTGDTVTLDGAKGDFKVSSIDKDGTYHVVSADGQKGYKVSENHITGNKGNADNKSNNKENTNPEMASNQSEDAQDKKMSDVYKWDESLRNAVKTNDKDEQKKLLDKIEKEYQAVKKQKLTEDETDYIEFFHDKAKKWLNGGVPSTNVSARALCTFRNRKIEFVNIFFYAHKMIG